MQQPEEVDGKFPLQAGPADPIKLPGQTRVDRDEYQEFLALGHGGIFDLDIDRYSTAAFSMHHTLPGLMLLLAGPAWGRHNTRTQDPEPDHELCGEGPGGKGGWGGKGGVLKLCRLYLLGLRLRLLKTNENCLDWI